MFKRQVSFPLPQSGGEVAPKRLLTVISSLDKTRYESPSVGELPHWSVLAQPYWTARPSTCSHAARNRHLTAQDVGHRTRPLTVGIPEAHSATPWDVELTRFEHGTVGLRKTVKRDARISGDPTASSNSCHEAVGQLLVWVAVWCCASESGRACCDVLCFCVETLCALFDVYLPLMP